MTKNISESKLINRIEEAEHLLRCAINALTAFNPKPEEHRKETAEKILKFLQKTND
jgi:hypothetical protein